MLASDWEDGTLGHAVTRFAEDADEQLARIAGEIRSGTYEPGQLMPVELPRPVCGMLGGSWRLRPGDSKP